MLKYVRICLILLLVAEFGSCQFNCISNAYTDSGELTLICSKGCTGKPPFCFPHCEKQCPSLSKCTRPDKCECESGYELMNQTDPITLAVQSCQPICNPDCLNKTYCAAPNVCKCLEGHKAVFNKDGVLENCTPICNPDCSDNSYCVAPNVCKCREGFKPVRNNDGVLESCSVINQNSLTALHILIYSVLICSLLLITIASVLLVTKWLKGRRHYVTNENQNTNSWRTSYASYCVDDVKS